MISASILILFGTLQTAGGMPEIRPTGDDTGEMHEILLLDRLHQTFLLLNQVAIPAYIEHFRGEPENLAVVQYYAERLRAVTNGEAPKLPVAAPIPKGASSELHTPRNVWMRAALSELRKGATDIAEHHLKVLGAQPHGELRRADETRQANTARCVLYDPELFWAHRRLWELKTGHTAQVVPANVSQAIDQGHAAIRSLRDQSGERELSLRKFLDKHRHAASRLAWLYRCRGMELDRHPHAARTCFLRAWAIADALFPASERGRLDRFDPVFLAELGDVYARLERFDLMLRYIYCDEGLPARYELARPVAELARVAESVRLGRADKTTAAHEEQELPETVSQILFDQPVVTPSKPRPAQVVGNIETSGRVDLGWVFVVVGGCLVCTAIAWGIVRVARRPHRQANQDL
jgi:hypothetical protein